MQGISVDKIGKKFGSFTALDNVSLTVNPNEFLSILGPSGCGKSTLLRIIAGLESPTSGQINIAGEDVTNLPVWKRKIGFVFQNFALWPHLSVFRNVSMGLELRGTAKAKIADQVMEALRLVQLDTMANRYPAQLSGGQQQRVALARAIVLKPAVLLLDEPLSALDKNLRQDMQVELKSLQQKLGLTTVFVTHDQEEALSLSDRVVVMNNGTIEQLNTPQEIYNLPASAYVAKFVGEAHFFTGKIETLGAKTGLRLQDGTIVPVSGRQVKPGDPGLAFVRPEWIKLGKANGSSSIDLPKGTVERLMFFGQTSDYLVRLGEHQLRVKRKPDDPNLEQGDTVTLECEAKLLPYEDGVPS